MGRLISTSTRRIESSTTFTREDLVEFIADIPEQAQIRVSSPQSYPGETGVTPGYIEATWSE